MVTLGHEAVLAPQLTAALGMRVASGDSEEAAVSIETPSVPRINLSQMCLAHICVCARVHVWLCHMICENRTGTGEVAADVTLTHLSTRLDNS